MFFLVFVLGLLHLAVTQGVTTELLAPIPLYNFHRILVVLVDRRSGCSLHIPGTVSRGTVVAID